LGATIRLKGQSSTVVGIMPAGFAFPVPAQISLSKRFEGQYPATNAGRSITAIRLREELYRFTLPLFSLLELAAVFVLALGANLTNLLLVRLTTRAKELALLGGARCLLLERRCDSPIFGRFWADEKHFHRRRSSPRKRELAFCTPWGTRWDTSCCPWTGLRW
jgi:hypothetical protein